MTLVAQPLVYAAHAPASPQALRPALVGALMSIAFGGLAGASCAFMMRAPRGWAAVHATLFIVTALVAWRAGKRLARSGEAFPALASPVRPLLDAVAAVCIAVIGLLPLIATFAHTDFWHWDAGRAVCGLAFAVLAATSIRHRQRCRSIATAFGPAGYPRTAYALDAVGDVRVAFETLWLSIVAAALLAPSLRLVGGPVDESVVQMLTIAVYACAWIYALIWAQTLLVYARCVWIARGDATAV